LKIGRENPGEKSLLLKESEIYGNIKYNLHGKPVPDFKTAKGGAYGTAEEVLFLLRKLAVFLFLHQA
jgi:hypothetical protein